MPLITTLSFAVTLAVVFAAAVAFFDALRHSSQAFDAVGRGSKPAWLIGMAIATIAVFIYGMTSLPGIIATIATIVYHVDQKPKLIEIVRPRW